MDSPKISVIIPVFNGERYLDRCVDSIMNQTYENLEIVLIDDGSNDSTPQMCDRYQEIDGRVKVVHKANSGLSGARNEGIKAASGEFVTFIDSDDFVLTDYVNYLYSLIVKYSVDLAVCCHTVVCRNGRRIACGGGEETAFSSKDALENMLYHDRVDLSVWGKLYRRSLFDGIEYPYGKYFEDAGTTFKLIDKAGRIAYGPERKYEYILRHDSLISDKYTARKLDLLEMTDRMALYISDKYPDLSDATLRRRVYSRFSTLNQMVFEAGCAEERKEILTFIRKHGKAVYANPKTPSRDKIALNILKFGYPLYSIVWKMYIKLYKGSNEI